MSIIDNQNLVTQSIPLLNPITDLFIHKKPKLQVQPNNQYELKDHMYNTKDRYLLTSICVKVDPPLLSLATKKIWALQFMLKSCLC